MSGIVGLANTDGRQLDSLLLRRLTDALALRGPDEQQVWAGNEAGLGHAMLRTTEEALHETQPCSLDGCIWITADARIDGREDLMRRLKLRPEAFHPITDPELILHAYQAWGDACVDHLLGDFAFAIWDEPRRRLFCARDHFGVKPFYYARVGDGLIISNTLNCVRLHPQVSDRLNEQAIGDFLLIGSNEEPDTTAFADIQRLPAAHTLTWTNGELRVRRYWTLPIKDELYYRRESEYVEHFRELLDVAISDRLRTEKIGVFMSGGMDSTTIAAAACDLLTRRAEPFDLRAYTVVYERLFNDPERHYSGLAADHLGIPIHYQVVDDYALYERHNAPEMITPEPSNEPLYAINPDQYRTSAAHTRVALSGEGGDAVLRGSLSYLLKLARKGRLDRIVSEVGRHLWVYGRLPEIGFRTRVRSWLNWSNYDPYYPQWLNREFEARLHLRERFEHLCADGPLLHPRRPEAYRFLTTLFWTNQFEYYDPGVTRFPVETRHPLFDLRLLDFLLALPTLPVCVDKRLMRAAMGGLLPEAVRQRRKQCLMGDPYALKLREGNPYQTLKFEPQESLLQWIDVSAISLAQGISSGDINRDVFDLAPFSFNLWLRDGLSPSHRSAPAGPVMSVTAHVAGC